MTHVICLVIAMSIIAGCNHRSTVLDKPPVVSRKLDPMRNFKTRGSVKPDQQLRRVTTSLTIEDNEFTSSLKKAIEKGMMLSPPVDMSSGKFELVSLEADPSPEMVKACEDAMDKRSSDPTYQGDFSHGIWIQYEEPAEGEMAATYIITSAILPLVGSKGDLRCFAVNFANPFSESVKSPSIERSFNLFVRQDPSTADTWETDPEDTVNDGTDNVGESSLDVFKDWLKRRLGSGPMGVRWLEVMKVQGQTKADKLRTIVISKTKSETN